MEPAAIEAARKKLAARMGGASAQIGGKGTVRRKPAKGNKEATLDDKKLQAVLKRHGVSSATGIEEVSIFKTDGSFTYFSSPKLQANPAANTYVVTGKAEERKASPSGMPSDLMAQLSKQFPGMNPAELLKQLQKGGLPGMGGAGPGGAEEDMPDLEGVSFDAPAGGDDDDDMPALEKK